MAALSAEVVVERVLGPDGEVAFGKQFAGREVSVEQPERGVWLVKTAEATTEKRWLLDDPKAMAGLKRAIEWEETHPPDDSNTEELLGKWTAELLTNSSF